MNLVKWIRRNRRQVMTFVVIFCMISFVVGYTGLKILGSIFDQSNKTIAHYDGGKVKRIDWQYAQAELGVLRMLRAEQLMASQGMNGALLSHLLFPDSQFSSGIAAQLKQAVQQGQVQMSMEDLENYFNQRPGSPEELWILLKAEAYRAGYIFPNAKAKEILRMVIPQMMQVDAARLISQIMSQSNLTEDAIFRIFADLLTIVNYANSVMDNQAVTLNQVKASLGRSQERLDAEYVKIDAEPFIEKNAAVTDADIQTQFEAYKQLVPNNTTEDNPFGFGYQLPKRVQLEYMILLTDDVKSQVEAPTAEAMEEFYSKNIERFQTEVPSDPNDSESEKITETKTYVEAEPQIRYAIENDKTTKLAGIIFNEIKDVTESGFEEITFDEATVDQLQMAAGDYQTAAKEVSEKYNVPIIAGKTGWLSPDDFRQEKILIGLSMQQQRNRIPLSDLAFIANADPQQQVRRIGLPSIRVWQNIGPVKGGYYAEEESKYYPMMAIVRVIGIRDAAIPENVDVEYDTTGVSLSKEVEQEKTVFSLKENIKEDLLLQKAMDAAKARGKELATRVAEKDWDQAIADYNTKYAKPESEEQSPQEIELDSAKQQIRISQAEIAMAKQYIQDNPVAAGYMQQRLTMNMLNNLLYGMLQEGSASTGTLHKVLVFEPGAACYVVKEVIRQPATIDDYLENKANTAMQLNMQSSAELALVHFNSQNILKRMNYKYKKENKQDAENEDAPVEEESEE